ncbi:MAG: DegT/DnrJ/EryC1/StrS family aminotransferase [Candidatus Peribacteraceae bacterium]|nr:DegT/DnrJ/EryC1/StrS family aminotransferase [Candidatus Peribacteraceae bacterium]MDD5742633.1 DegT/DnrJ/EryC1/StrS family aminotransferase [Candidatus Peribacteraceae bacterium]
MPLFRPIHHTFAPHVNAGYVLRTLALLLKPWKWREGPERETLRAALARQYDADVSLFASGREALVALFRSLKSPDHAEVIVQAYTCVVVPNAMLAAGMHPVYADVEAETLNLDPADVERRLTPRTRAVICQHTFGIPADTHKLRALCDRYGLLLIEDCAHILPDDQGPATIGKDGDFLLLSFGRDKAISGITGGAILSRRPAVSVQLRAEEGAATALSLFRIKRLLLYPLVYAVARPLYGIGLGKALLILARAIGALVPILTSAEKNGTMSPTLHTLPNACAALALAELHRLKAINDHRRRLTALYLTETYKLQATGYRLSIPKAVHPDLPLQKFPLFVKDAERIRRALKQKNIHLQDGWSGCVICPPGSAMEHECYVPGSDPAAEAAAGQILSLPTHPTMTEKLASELVRELSGILDRQKK